MQEKIIKAFEEIYGDTYETFEELKSECDIVEILGTWLAYEGISEYTADIILLLKECGIHIDG